MADYESMEKQQLDKAQQQQSRYEAERNRLSQDLINQINQAIDTATRPVRQQYEQQIANVPEQYKSLYSANAVQQEVNRRQLEERMANMGLTDSGLNRTQQTAVTLQRGNADNAVRLQEQAAKDELSAALNELLANAAAQKQQQAAQIGAQAASDILGNRTSLYNNAVNAAVQEYNAALQNELARQQLAQEQAQWEAEQALARQQLENERASLPERYRQEAVQILLNQGYSYPEAYNAVYGSGAAGLTGSSGSAGTAGTAGAGGTLGAAALAGANAAVAAAGANNGTAALTSGFSVSQRAAVEQARARTMANDYNRALALLLPLFQDSESLGRAVEAAGIPDRVLTEYLNAVRGGTTANYLFG